MWQFLSGGAEDSETPPETARREMMEEAGIPADRQLIQLDSRASIPRDVYDESAHWPAELFVVTEYSFGVDVEGINFELSDEHDEFRWLTIEQASEILEWDSNRVALWELNERLRRQLLWPL
jgi:dATP pyrophosphohydrolase